MTVFVGSHWCLLQHLYLPKLKFIASISGTVLWTFSGHDCSLFYIFKCFFSLTFAYSFQSPTCIGYILIIFNLVNFFVCTSSHAFLISFMFNAIYISCSYARTLHMRVWSHSTFIFFHIANVIFIIISSELWLLSQVPKFYPCEYMNNNLALALFLTN